MPLIRIISKAMVATIAAGVAVSFVASGAAAQSADRPGNPFLRLLPGQQSTTTTTTIVVERTRFRKSAWRSHDARSHDNRSHDDWSYGARIHSARSHGTPSHGTQSDGTQSDGTQSDGTQSDGTQSDGTQSDDKIAVQDTDPDSTKSAGTTGNSAAANSPESPSSNNRQAADQAQPSAIVIDGHTAQIAASNQVNTLDLAANEAPPMESTLPPGDRADSAVTTAAPTAAFVAPTPADANRNNGDRNARAQSVSRDMSRDTDEDASADANQDSSAVSAPSGLAQILAGLGGAATAAVIAWFLIGSMGTYAARSVAVTRPPARRRPPSAT
jgi:hypothetical protein